MQNRPAKIYPTIESIVKQETDVAVEKISQPPYGTGICGGSSVVHITKQLQSNTANSQNPFNNPHTLRSASLLQHHCNGYQMCFIDKLDENFPREQPKKNESLMSRYETNDTRTEIEKIKEKLTDKIQHTKEDEISRGIFIRTNISRNPNNGEKYQGGHALSMTVQKVENEFFCTAMDTNFFFASAKGEAGCNKIAEKMADTLAAYKASYIGTYTVKKR